MAGGVDVGAVFEVEATGFDSAGFSGIGTDGGVVAEDCGVDDNGSGFAGDCVEDGEVGCRKTIFDGGTGGTVDLLSEPKSKSSSRFSCSVFFPNILRLL